MDLDSTPITRDVQLDEDTRRVAIQEVGISDVKFPVQVTGVELDDEACQLVSATGSLAVSLSKTLKGIHMSRLMEDLLAQNEQISLPGINGLLHALKTHQGAEDASFEMTFDYFLERQAPVSGRTAKQAYRCRYRGRLQGSRVTLTQYVEVPVTTLCPCSKEISEYGAHNQRGYVEIELQHQFTVEQNPEVKICLEELIEGVESKASSPLYPVLKRTDERYVTMQAYEQPRFVEDMVREVAVMLRDDARIDRWTVRVTNHESIHQHNAYAVVSGGR
jgi:GTP cyclohydrolase I